MSLFRSAQWELLPTKIEGGASCCGAVTIKERKLVVLGGTDSTHNETQRVSAFDMSRNEWTSRLPAMPIRWAYGTAVVANNHIFAFGGKDDRSQGYLNTVMALDLETCQEWTNLPPLPNLLYNCTAVAVDEDRIAVLGGTKDLYEPQKQVHVFHIHEQRWSRLPNMHIGRNLCSAVMVHSKLYVIGGCDRYVDHDSVEMFDFSTEEWTLLSSSRMNEERVGCSAVVVGDFVVVMGGHNQEQGYLKSVEAFSTSTHKWTRLPDMTTARIRLSAALVGKHIVVAGGLGDNGGSVLDTVERVEIDSYYVLVPKLSLLMQQDDVPLGLWANILAKSPLSVVHHIIRSDKFTLDSVLFRLERCKQPIEKRRKL